MDKRNNIDRYRQKIGMVFQNFNVFPHMTALENITLAPMLPKAEAEYIPRRGGFQQVQAP